MMIVNHELNGKDIDITTLNLHNEKMRNDLKREKEFANLWETFTQGVSAKDNLLDFNSCHYCQEYGHATKNCIRMHFRSD